MTQPATLEIGILADRLSSVATAARALPCVALQVLLVVGSTLVTVFFAAVPCHWSMLWRVVAPTHVWDGRGGSGR